MPHILNGRPTQEPLNREEQKSAFEALKRQYTAPQEPQPQPRLPFQEIKEFKLSAQEQLKALEQQMKDRGMEPTAIAKVEEKVQETEKKQVVKQFYCRHVFQRVEASFWGLPIRTKICSKCGLVK